ncbi:TonB-dependent receptor [Intestinirhabdus alba]|jgi:iron complex outermembrane receptor protein|uniref:TonB-dependent siderophore receptor n=1 Tax=Intestinirhabdus alba TaxID=2899544 RepID=A0A6L6IUB0_9ENTR|nr:TonB-dependent siderophore receptor [Intestinirhabdus alba]MTH48323.1 TonB-dependent siderophore receptor [Intestinirhabdus alba]
MEKHSQLVPLLPLVIALTASGAQAAGTEEEIIVTGQPSGDTTHAASGAGFKTNDIDPGPLGNRAWVDTPYSTTTVQKEVVENQQAQSVSDLLKYSPSTQMQARGGMDVGRPQSRGMQGSVVANSRLDGLNIVATTAFPVEMLERMDVLNSLTGALYGPASPAGQFNFVAKRPTEETLNKVTFGYQSRSAFTGQLDLGGHIDDGKRFGYRINVLNQDGEGSLDDSTRRRRLLAVALDWNIQPGTQLQLDASHYEFIQKGYPGSFSYGPGVKLPSAPDPQNKNLALSTAGNELTTDTVSTRLIHYLNDDWSLTTGVGWQQADRAMRSVSSKIINNQGDINRSMKDSTAAGRFRVLSNTTTLNGHVLTGSVGHDLALSTTGYVWSRYSATTNGPSYSWESTNMYHPAGINEQGDGKIRTGGHRYKSGVDSQQSITLGDILTFTPKWSAMLYLSQSWLQSQSYGKNGHKTKQTDKNGLSPTAALMYKITPSVMSYISYAESLEQGGTAPTDSDVKNAGQTLDPYRSKQYEIGLKADVSGMNLGAALFRLERPFAWVDSADNVYKEQGEQVNKGLELTASGNVWQGLNIYSGVTFLNPKLKDTVNASTSNKQVVGVPKVQANLLAEYSLPSMPQWVYSANVHYTGRRAANDTNTAWAGSYTTWDLGTRYTTNVGKVPTTFRVVVNNVFDKHYWASIFPSGTDGNNGSPSAFIGSGREVRASVTLDF